MTENKHTPRNPRGAGAPTIHPSGAKVPISFRIRRDLHDKLKADGRKFVQIVEEALEKYFATL